ncbi:MAG: hypothetical protein HYY30_12075 [Chloroflexi bacterium]|nr:hypothetical protein [Chloroflexota bacterium]
MRVLHIVRERKDSWPAELAARQREQGNEVAVLLMHDAVLAAPPAGIKTYACRDDVVARAVETTAESVDYDAIVRLIFAYDSVSWW